MISKRRMVTGFAVLEDMWLRLWVVNDLQEGDYHIEVKGEVYGPYQPWLTFRHMGNDFLDVLVLVGAVLSSLVCSVAIVMGAVFLVATLCGLCAGAVARMPHCKPVSSMSANL